MYKLLIATFLISGNIIAQTPSDTFIQMKDVVLLSEQNYHLLKARKYEADAAFENVDVVKYSRLPTIDASYQADVATANNLTGMFYPNGILPISGPPSSSNNYNLATGSAASILLNWQAVTFGQRNAQIDVSVAEANSKNLEWKQELFRHKINVISAYLDILLSIDVMHIHEQNIQRVEANLTQSRTLTISGIKPGVDTALFLSELSKAKVDLLNAQRQLQTQQWLLAQLIVVDVLPVPTDTNFLNKLPLMVVGNDTSFSNHPIIQYSQSQLVLSKSREQLLKKSYLPKLNVWGTGFARGSGFESNQPTKTWDGLSFNRYNYGAGLQLTFPIMKYGEVKRQLQQQNFLSKASEEKLEDNKETLITQQRIANSTFNNSMAIAAETQQQLKSGQYAFTAMQVRYNTGLVNFSDLIQAQYNLLKAELDVKKANWDAWKALLLEAAVSGDENIFLGEIK
ncbi:MAG TPA: TolC family protein [Chitinophagaceae bacterium]|nr:TolC family protein [Chitinophagaceae bacterium]